MTLHSRTAQTTILATGSAFALLMAALGNGDYSKPISENGLRTTQLQGPAIFDQHHAL